MNQAVANLVNLYCVGQSYASIFFREHPRVRQTAEEFVERLRILLRERQAESVFLGIANGRVVVDGEVLVGPTLIAKRYKDAMDALQSGGLQIHRDLYPGELVDLFTLTHELKGRPRGRDAATRLLNERQLTHVRLSPRYGEPGWMGHDDLAPLSGDFSLDTLFDVFLGLRDYADEAHERARAGRDVCVNSANHSVEQILHAVNHQPGDMLNLSFYPDYDTYTIGHSVRVSLFAVLVGQRLGVPGHRLIGLGTAGLLHDIGKARVPQEILYKTGRLSREEAAAMSRHAWFGGQILLETEDATSWSLEAAYGHHARPNGRGYPQIPSWAVVSPVSRLVQVCDVFEALTAVRPYKPALPPWQAYQIMLQNKDSFDPRMLRALISVTGLYPPGSRLLLSSGEQALAVKAGSKLDRPLVRVTHDRHGIALERTDQPLLDLSAPDTEVRVQKLLGNESMAPEARPALPATLPEDPCHPCVTDARPEVARA